MYIYIENSRLKLYQKIIGSIVKTGGTKTWLERNFKNYVLFSFSHNSLETHNTYFM